MKVVAVVGSIRRGNTLKMVQASSSQFLPEEIDIIDLGEIKFSFCTGCLYCDETQHCCIDDDLTKLMDKIAEADAYIFASPVRWSLLSGEIKTFFDRLNPFASVGTLSGKKCILLTVGQSEKESEDAFSINDGLKSMEFFCENAGIEIVDKVKAYGCLSESDIDESSYLEMCCTAAERLRSSLL